METKPQKPSQVVVAGPGQRVYSRPRLVLEAEAEEGVKADQQPNARVIAVEAEVVVVAGAVPTPQGHARQGRAQMATALPSHTPPARDSRGTHPESS